MHQHVVRPAVAVVADDVVRIAARLVMSPIVALAVVAHVERAIVLPVSALIAIMSAPMMARDRLRAECERGDRRNRDSHVS
jgi:hypothetical protein